MVGSTSRRACLGASVSLLSLIAAPAFAADAAASDASASTVAGQVSEIVVTAQRLDAARSEVEPALGATTYSMPEAFINNLPSGANVQLNQVILQAPGAAQDSFGQLHIRGDHGNIQFRLNNVILRSNLSLAWKPPVKAEDIPAPSNQDFVRKATPCVLSATGQQWNTESETGSLRRVSADLYSGATVLHKKDGDVPLDLQYRVLGIYDDYYRQPTAQPQPKGPHPNRA